MTFRLGFLGCLCGLLFACSAEDSKDESSAAGSGSAGMTAGQDAGESGQASAGMAGAGVDGTGAGQAGQAGQAGDGGDIERMPLPGESRIFEHVLNLVDADAEAQLLAYLDDGTLSLELPAQRFYEVFPDEYDFLFFLTDRALDGLASGTHCSVRQTPIVGTGLPGHEPYLEYYSAEKLRAVIAINRSPGAFPPFGHEIVHDWANFLDPSLGFGKELNLDLGPHWGLASVFGQLGGFDASTIRCETPAGAMPPDCTPLDTGRTRYVVGSFGPHTNSFQSVNYGPLELYLMGLIPLSEVPESFTVMLDGAIDFESFADADGNDTLVVEASGLGQIAMADVVRIHGERPPATEEEKHFTSAFVVVSSTPAGDDVMAEINAWAEIFGNHEAHQNWQSFEQLTGGRATLETRLGLPRAVDDPLAIPMQAPPTLTSCDLIEQQCPTGLGCYYSYDDEDSARCHSAGAGAVGERCTRDNDCAPGNTCSFGVDSLCAPYCDLLDRHPEKSCALLCPAAIVEIVDDAGVETIGAYCLAGAGMSCDPLAPQCDAGSACYGHQQAGCAIAGTTLQGEACEGVPSECEPTTTCVGLTGGSGFTCQPYCDPSPAATGDNACGMLCPGRFWTFNDYGLCMPDA